MLYKIVFISCAFFCFFLDLVEAKSAQEVLSEISIDDQKELERLFHDFVQDDHFGYTLFGDKPVSFTGHFIVTPWENTLEGLSQAGIFWKQWHIWEKHRAKFEIKKYLLIKEPALFRSAHAIFLINKKAFVECVNTHLNIFEKILGHKFSAHQTLIDIESGKTSFLNAINRNETLLGILLGYGLQNAILYNLDGRVIDRSKLEFFGDYDHNSLRRIDSVHFVVDPHSEETKALQRKYEHLRNNLSEIYANGNFFKTSLLKLIE